jgi:hypothetical protein
MMHGGVCSGVRFVNTGSSDLHYVLEGRALVREASVRLLDLSNGIGMESGHFGTLLYLPSPDGDKLRTALCLDLRDSLFGTAGLLPGTRSVSFKVLN